MCLLLRHRYGCYFHRSSVTQRCASQTCLVSIQAYSKSFEEPNECVAVVALSHLCGPKITIAESPYLNRVVWEHSIQYVGIKTFHKTRLRRLIISSIYKYFTLRNTGYHDMGSGYRIALSNTYVSQTYTCERSAWYMHMVYALMP